jgi:hypothetical protein
VAAFGYDGRQCNPLYNMHVFYIPWARPGKGRASARVHAIVMANNNNNKVMIMIIMIIIS